MTIKELDVVQMKEGYTATVLAVFNEGEGYLVEITDERGKTVDISTMAKSDIEKVLWNS